MTEKGRDCPEILQNCKTALRIFISKCPEPMRGLLYCRNPDNLEQAIQILAETGYAHQNLVQNDKQHNRYPNNRNSDKNYSKPQETRTGTISNRSNETKPRNTFYHNNRYSEQVNTRYNPPRQERQDNNIFNNNQRTYPGSRQYSRQFNNSNTNNDALLWILSQQLVGK